MLVVCFYKKVGKVRKEGKILAEKLQYENIERFKNMNERKCGVV